MAKLIQVQEKKWINLDAIEEISISEFEKDVAFVSTGSIILKVEKNFAHSLFKEVGIPASELNLIKNKPEN